MDDNGTREMLERYWSALERTDLEGAAADLHADFVEEWPQSGERIMGPDNWLAMATNHPTFPAIRHVRTVGSGDVWATHAVFDYAEDGSARFEVCAILECRDGKIAKLTEFFGAPFEAAAWRTEWVERA